MFRSSRIQGGHGIGKKKFWFSPFSYVAELNHWSPELHHGAECSHFEDPCRIGAEEDKKCEDCLSSGHSSEGSLSGKGKRTMSKSKDKKVRI